MVQIYIQVKVFIICLLSHRLSASCVHISALLHALKDLSPCLFPLRATLPVMSNSETSEIPCTSLPCTWNKPRKRKEAKLQISDVLFQKHVYSRKRKHTLKQLQDFDPRPKEFRGLVNAQLPQLLETIQDKSLCMFMLFDPHTRHWEKENIPTPTEYHILSKTEMLEAISSLKQSLKLTPQQIRKLEIDTRQQNISPLWHQARKLRITSSVFGDVKQRKDETKPDCLVTRILGLKEPPHTVPALEWGRHNEAKALEAYVSHQNKNGHPDLFAAQSGFIVSSDYPVLGASPDASIYDPSCNEPYGFAEIKCPFTHRERSPVEACKQPSFFCDLVNEQVTLKQNHRYYAQVQGQMAIGERPWCDFVVFTTKGISVERIKFNQLYWSELCKKLLEFYDCCVAPEIIQPMHLVGLPMRDLRKE